MTRTSYPAAGIAPRPNDILRLTAPAVSAAPRIARSLGEQTVTTIVHHRDFRPFKSRPLDPHNPHGVIEDGEALSFDIMFRDAASKPTSATTSLDAERERAVSFEVGRAMAQHHLRFAFMGDRAPAFDRERAELIVRQRLATDAQAASARSAALAAARHQDSANLTDAVTGARNQRAYALVNHYRAARSNGE